MILQPSLTVFFQLLEFTI